MAERRERCRAGLSDENKDGDNHVLCVPYPVFTVLSLSLREGQMSYLRPGPLLWVTGCHEDGYFVRPILIKIDNCVDLSSSDDSWDKLTFNLLITAFSEHFS